MNTITSKILTQRQGNGEDTKTKHVTFYTKLKAMG
jgi:hypothetical protein